MLWGQDQRRARRHGNHEFLGNLGMCGNESCVVKDRDRLHAAPPFTDTHYFSGPLAFHFYRCLRDFLIKFRSGLESKQTEILLVQVFFLRRAFDCFFDRRLNFPREFE